MFPSDFLLTTKTGRTLYESVKALPIVDYHNHLSLSQLAENHRFRTPYELWLEPDPYKNRTMRMCGVEEKFITGSASPEEKFIRWCETIPKLTGNVMSVWARMEWEAVFSDIPFPTPEKAAECYRLATEYLKKNEVTVESLCKQFGVELLCPCISPLEKAEDFHSSSSVVPSLRCDDAAAPTAALIQKLEREEQTAIRTLSDYKALLQNRLKGWKAIGAKFADHAIDAGFVYCDDDGKNDARFEKLLTEPLSSEDRAKLFSHLLVFLCREEARLGMVAQFHLGAQRHTSSRLRTLAGAAGGYAAMGSGVDAGSLCALLDEIEKGEYGLPKTVLFPLNPADNAMISILSGSFSKDGVAGLITQGPAWWWCDHKQGMEQMLEHNAVFGLLFNFIGMTTDSRSFLSLVRHDYFRRVLCDWLGKKSESGDYPERLEELTELAKLMSYENARNIIEKGV